MSSVRELALLYARRGFAVLPTRGKIPLVANGVHGASTSEASIRDWFVSWPTAGVGIAAGASGLVIIDLDVKNGVDGLASWEAILGGLEIKTLTAETPSGGRHLYFHAPAGIDLAPSAGKLGPGVDVRAGASYCIAPPTVIDGRPYKWLDLAEPQPLPEPLLARLQALQTAAPAPMVPTASGMLYAHSGRPSWGDGVTAFDRVIRALGARGSRIKLTRGGAMAQCPCHEDTDPSLHITKKPGRVLLRDHGGCAVESILAALGLHPGDLFDDAPQDTPSSAIAGKTPADTKDGKPVGRLFSEIEPGPPTDWVWKGVVPRARFALFEGDGERGKSTLLIDIAARITTGRPMPFQEQAAAPAGVVWIGYEDGADTLRSRLDAAGADLSRCLELCEVGDRLLSLPNDIHAIEAGIARVQAALIVLDPILAALNGRTDSHGDQSVRAALTPLVKLLERTGCAGVGIRHWSKDRTRKAAHRGGGSVAFTSLSRAVWAFVPDGECLVMARVKGNLARNPAGVRFVLEDKNGVPVVRYLAPEPRHCDEILEGTNKPGAVKFLQDLLRGGKPMDSEEVVTKGQAAGFNRNQLFKNKDAAGVRARKSGFSGGWTWRLEDAEESSK